MKTNLDKWNHYKGIIDAREEAYVKSVITEMPKAFYSVYPSGSIGEKAITKVRYGNGRNLCFNKRPTVKDIDKIKLFAETVQVFDKSRVYFDYDEVHSNYKSSGSISLKDISTYLSKENAEKKSIEIKTKNEQEEILLQNGHTRCERCRKVVPTDTIIKSKIIGRGRKQVFNNSKGIYESKACITEEVMNFCSGTCASHEQMSREG